MFIIILAKILVKKIYRRMINFNIVYFSLFPIINVNQEILLPLSHLFLPLTIYLIFLYMI